ncbi:MAG: GTPase [Planctomycetota bacterium]
MPRDTPLFEVETPRSPGAVAVIRVQGSGEPRWIERIGLGPVAVGGLVLRRIYGVDDALLARLDDRTVLVMPHGGVAVTRAIERAMLEAGCARNQPAPESDMRGRVGLALARAASPLAIDLLLDQPRRWEAFGDRTPGDGEVCDARVLGRLIDPPAVVAVGRPNIGKSSLLNRLAGRSLALAFDEVGTTRDAVGAMIDAAGLVVRWLDTPGLPNAGSCGDRLANEPSLIRAAVSSADLLILCRDASGEQLTESEVPGIGERDIPLLRVVTRVDRDRDGTPSGEIRTSASTGEGMGELVAAIREALVPRAVYDDPRPWKFWA